MGLIYNPIHKLRKDNMKLEINDTFTIGFFAKDQRATNKQHRTGF